MLYHCTVAILSAQLVGDLYVGFDVHRAARIAAAGHGGQVLLSEATHGLVKHELTEGVIARDLGTFRLKDLQHAEALNRLGLAFHFEGDEGRALDLMEESIALARKQTDSAVLALACGFGGHTG